VLLWFLSPLLPDRQWSCIFAPLKTNQVARTLFRFVWWFMSHSWRQLKYSLTCSQAILRTGAGMTIFIRSKYWKARRLWHWFSQDLYSSCCRICLYSRRADRSHMILKVDLLLFLLFVNHLLQLFVIHNFKCFWAVKRNENLLFVPACHRPISDYCWRYRLGYHSFCFHTILFHNQRKTFIKLGYS